MGILMERTIANVRELIAERPGIEIDEDGLRLPFSWLRVWAIFAERDAWRSWSTLSTPSSMC
jgi:hypothetical protein